MIGRLIDWSANNRLFVVLGALALVLGGLLALRSTPIDALPDLSDTQVIIRTSYPGQAPQIVENQITYPLATTMLSVPGAKTVRGYSFFGDSFVYVIFADGTDLYWARSRVLEYLNQVQGRLPDTARSAIGPDATGVGWVYHMRWSIGPADTTSRSCGRSRTGSSATSSRACLGWPKSPASAAWSSNIRSCSIR
jgi:copper/silver efflux system protein